jgi:hypothetical protein
VELPPWTDPSFGSVMGFVVVVGFVAASFVAMAIVAGAEPIRTSLGAVLWLAVTGGAAGTGLLDPGPMPPPLFVFFFTCLSAATALALSPLGRRMAESVSWAALIGVQVFRLPLELILHRWYEEGIVPIQMTFEGWNFDIVSGVACGLAAVWLFFRPRDRRVALGANIVGSALLMVVMGLAMTSAPGPLFSFTDSPPIQLPLHFPTVWIVSVCVAGALFFHIVTFRALGRPTR